MIKSIVFGLTVTFVALRQGYACRPTPEGVARATTRTVVMASLAVLGLDFVLTALMFRSGVHDPKIEGKNPCRNPATMSGSVCSS